MSYRFVARALVAVALLGTTTFASADEPSTVQMCADAVGCVSLFAGPGGTNAGASVDACGPETASPSCVDVAAGGGVDTAPTDHSSADKVLGGAKHPWQAWCNWAGSAGSRVDFGGRLIPGTASGVTVTAMSLDCDLYENNVAIDSVSVDHANWNGTIWLQRTNTGSYFGGQIKVCMNAYIRWSDGAFEALATANCGALPT